MTGRDERLAAAHDRLAEAVDAITTGADWAAMLAVAARFHSYSANNVMLIHLACPDATRVGGYQLWKSLGRQVRAGEAGIPILAPVVRRASMTNRGHGWIDPEDDIPAPVLVGFKVAHVFDISQTDGAELPDVAPRLLAGQGPIGAFTALAGHLAGQGYAVERGPLSPANGRTDFVAHTVLIADRLSDAAAVKTLAHEAGHCHLHRHQAPAGMTRDQAEVEAESVAFVICSELGLGSDDYSFPYVAAWSGGQTELVAQTATRVIAAAREVLEAIDPPGPNPGPATRAVLSRPVSLSEVSPRPTPAAAAARIRR